MKSISKFGKRMKARKIQRTCRYIENKKTELQDDISRLLNMTYNMQDVICPGLSFVDDDFTPEEYTLLQFVYPELEKKRERVKKEQVKLQQVAHEYSAERENMEEQYNRAYLDTVQKMIGYDQSLFVAYDRLLMGMMLLTSQMMGQVAEENAGEGVLNILLEHPKEVNALIKRKRSNRNAI